MSSVKGNSGCAPTIQMLRRTLILMSVCGIFSFAVLLVRLYKLQIADHKYYEDMAIAQQLRQTNTASARGRIYDRNMSPLAISTTVDNVYLSPAEIEMYGEDKELIAKGLGEILNIERQELLEKMSRTGSWYVTAAKKLDRDTADRVRQFKIDHELRGVRLEPDTRRSYPNSSLACHVIGFVGTDNYGLEGIEAQYDKALTGSKGKTLRATNAYGTDLLFNSFEEYSPGEDGLNIVTTLDTTIQYYVEKHLGQAVRDYDIQNGAGAIAMDVNSGQILAMASLDGYDLNNFLDVSQEVKEQIAACEDSEQAEKLLREAQTRQWRNKALSDTYEPGSTFKIITLSMALEEGAVSLEDSFYCPGNVSVKGRTNPIRCWKDGGHSSQSLTQAVQHSCNVAFVNIGKRVGAERFYDYCEAFGFLELSDNADDNLSARTGIDLAGESESIWWSKNVFCSEKNLSQLAAASFGQTFTITPLQLITAVSACINGGYLMKPYIVQKMLDSDDICKFEREPEIVRQVISEQTSEKVRAILEKVVGDPREGTGRNAAVAGYRIGGKTGTSEKVSLEAATGQKEYIVSFVGFAPADKPQIAILLFLDTPSNRSGIYISGGQMAAPVVGRMMADILPYLDVERVETGDSFETAMPLVINCTLPEAQKLIKNSELRYRTIGSGDKVTNQLPSSGTLIAKDTETIIYLDADISQENETIPNLLGMSYKEARDTLSYYGLYINTSSPVVDFEDIVGWQSINAGTPAKHGSVVEVALVNSDTAMLGKY